MIAHMCVHCTCTYYLLFRILVLIEHLENRVKPVVPVDKYPICPKTIPLRYKNMQEYT